jgi:hypothetical protein
MHSGNDLNDHTKQIQSQSQVCTNISISLCLLFVLFVLAASRKSTNSEKYHLLEKRNPFYFLAYFFYFFLLFSYFLYFSAYFLHKFYLNFTFFLTFTCTLPVYFFHEPGK